VSDPTIDRNQVLVFRKIDAILAVLASSSRDLGLTEIARQTELSKATVHRLLTTLVRYDYVERGLRDGSYRLGLRLFELGAATQRRSDLRRRALPVMRGLAKETGESIYLGIRRENSVLCLDRIDGKHVEELPWCVGGALPLNVGASARVLLAGMGDEELEAFLREPLAELTRFTTVDAGAMRESVHQARLFGYAIGDEDIAIGVSAIGAPIRDAHGDVVAAISLAGVVERLTPDRAPYLITAVKTAGRDISKALGFSG
jgi:DNA-binding IclR family transcriptional regulator